ncbi:ribbon-helix-helix domain-containing protein [Phytobacter ursingii]|uniref:ribbon-helix-helix domain-containing protein n=1 Tax=Phytobacter ursingii TaxID=1972431 RepID=UPI00127DC6A1|nr:ribbon-helix-helix protein, CopG family [Salmonella enterica]EEB9173449.1 ribbon-helix-helix protein, CopG family [Salmonella enterica]HDS3483798.1 ribbon-helix-helix protein, CopG family [Escherichia coli]
MKRKASTFGLRLPPELLEQVNELAEKTNRTRTDVITDALRAYMGIQEPQGESGNRLDMMVELLQDIASTLRHGVPQKPTGRATRPRTEKQYGSTPDAQNAAQRPAGAEISGHYDEAEVMATIRRMREEQRDRGFRYDNKAIARALNEAGLLQSNGREWNNDRINTVITRRMPDLK